MGSSFEKCFQQSTEIIQSIEPEKITPSVITSEHLQKTTQIESSITNMELERSILSKKSEHLEDSLEKVEHQKNELHEKTNLVEHEILEIEFEKKKIAYENENKEVSFEIERKGELAELGRIESAIKLTECNLEEKADNLEKNLAEVKEQKKSLLLKTEKLEEKNNENEFIKQKLVEDFENKVTAIKIERRDDLYHRTHAQSRQAAY
jgi:chromosome segregation ATPase